jgi:formylglycine-generating enzyme required for sulfatase activity
VRITNRDTQRTIRVADHNPNESPHAKTWDIKPNSHVEFDFQPVGISHAIYADDGFAALAPVGKLKANPFGLFDMHGNVWDWCQDAMQADGQSQQVLRGGCFL